MATALEQLQRLPLGGAIDVGIRQIEHVLGVRYASEQYAHRFVWLMPWELAFLKQHVEVGLSYPLEYILATLRDCPQLPLIK